MLHGRQIKLKGLSVQLEPEILDYINFCASYAPDPNAADPLANMRDVYQRLCTDLARDHPHPAGVTIRDETVGNVPVRIYSPEVQGPHPCSLFLHGGGWVLGDLDSHDDWVAEMTASSGVALVAVDYRLSPEHAYPAALDDTRAVYEHILKHGADWGLDSNRVGVVGDSAGGNLAAALCVSARDHGKTVPKAQILIYPALGAEANLPAHQENANGPILTMKDMEFYWNSYMQGQEAGPHAAPLLSDRFDELPAAFVLVMQYDPLRDDGVVYAEKLREAGITVELYHAAGLVHGCMRARGTSPGTRAAFDAVCGALGRLIT